MTAGAYDFIVEQGARWFRTFTYEDNAGSAIPITDYTIEMQIREQKSDTTAAISLSVGSGITITDASNGVFTIEMTAAQTRAFNWDAIAFYDVELTPPSTTNTIRLIEGCVTLSREVTK